MAEQFLYSKRYSQQGGKLYNPRRTDFFSMSVPLDAKAKKTGIGELSLISNFVLSKIEKGGLDIKTANGLIGNGTTNNPIQIDSQWFDKNFLKSQYWPLSQVGDPNTETLPIAERRYGLSHNYAAMNQCLTAHVDSIGDLHIYHPVTDGSSHRITKSIWRKYATSTISSLSMGDEFAKIAPLYVGEYIGAVYPASNNAMLIEIWKNGSFSEFVCVNFNGSGNGSNFLSARLGSDPFIICPDYKNKTKAERLALIRSLKVNAFNFGNGDQYLLVPTLPDTKGSLGYWLLSVAKPTPVALIDTITVENPLGRKESNQDRLKLCSKLNGTTETDADRLCLITDNNITPLNLDRTDANPTYQLSVLEQDAKQLGVFLKFSQEVSISGGPTQYITGQFSFIFDLNKRTLTPISESKGRDYHVKRKGSTTDIEVIGPATHIVGNHPQESTSISILPDGNRLILTAPQQAFSKLPELQVFRNSDKVKGISLNDIGFGDFKPTQTRRLETPSLTSIRSNRVAVLFHNNLITTDAQAGGEIIRPGGGISPLNGTYNQATYSIFFNEQVTSVKGHQTTKEHRQFPNIRMHMNAFSSDRNELFYHNAIWGSVSKPESTFDANILVSGSVRGVYRIDPEVWKTMDRWIKESFPANLIPAPYTQIHTLDWSIIPGHQSVDRLNAFYRLSISFKSVDRFSPVYGIVGSVAAVIDVDSNGNCLLKSINPGTTKLKVVAANVLDPTLTAVIPKDPAYRNTSAFKYSSGSVDMLYQAGGDLGVVVDLDTIAVSANGNKGWGVLAANTNLSTRATRIVNNVSTVPDFVRSPTIHPTLGLGLVGATQARGAYYTFNPVNSNTLKEMESVGDTVVVGSSVSIGDYKVVITSDIPIHLSGEYLTIKPQIIDFSLMTDPITGDLIKPESSQFGLYAVIENGAVRVFAQHLPNGTENISIFDERYRLNPEHPASVFLGSVKTDALKVYEIKAVPFTRWEVSRASQIPAGGTIPVSGSFAGMLGDARSDNITVWPGVKFIEGVPREYTWGADDIYDADVLPGVEVIEAFWSTDAAGNNRIDEFNAGTAVYFQIRTIGSETSISIFLECDTLEPSQFSVGDLRKWVRIPLTVHNNRGSGNYKISIYQ